MKIKRMSSILCGDCEELLHSHHLYSSMRGVTPVFYGMCECCKRWKVVKMYYHTRKEGKNRWTDIEHTERSRGR